MVDAQLADKIKSIAHKYGMNISTYVKALIEAAIEAEERDIYAPKAIKIATLVKLLAPLTILAIPPELLQECNISGETAYHIGKRIGRTFKSLGIDGQELLELIMAPLGTLVKEKSKLILIASEAKVPKHVILYVKGLAEAFKYDVTIDGNMVIVEPK